MNKKPAVVSNHGTRLVDEKVSSVAIAKISTKETSNGYRNDRELLADYFNLVEVLKGVRLSMGQTAKMNEIQNKVNSINKSIDFRLKKSKNIEDGSILIPGFKKQKLDAIERLVVAIVCYFQAKNGEVIKLEDIYDMVSMGDRMKMIELNRYFQTDSRLSTCGLVTRCKKLNQFDHDKYELSEEIQRQTLNIIEKPKSEIVKKSPKGITSLAAPKSPRQIYDILSRYVIGQEEAKKTLSVAAYNHYQRVESKVLCDKTNVMLVGPTGCGKTYLVEILSQALNMPLFIADATQYSETGYVGQCIDEMFGELFSVAGKDPKKAARGIIFIDEIDKIATTWDNGAHHTQRDVSGKSVQEEILKSVESGSSTNWGYDTSKVLFIAGGAFSGLRTGRSELKKRQLGFGVAYSSGEKIKSHQFSIDDFVKFGMMPELMGRFHNLVQLDPLYEATLVRIMTEPEDSVIKQYQRLFEANGINLTIPEETITIMARKALAMNTGARGLKAIVEKVLNPMMFEIFGAKTGAASVCVLPEMVA